MLIEAIRTSMEQWFGHVSVSLWALPHVHCAEHEIPGNLFPCPEQPRIISLDKKDKTFPIGVCKDVGGEHDRTWHVLPHTVVVLPVPTHTECECHESYRMSRYIALVRCFLAQIAHEQGVTHFHIQKHTLSLRRGIVSHEHYPFRALSVRKVDMCFCCECLPIFRMVNWRFDEIVSHVCLLFVRVVEDKGQSATSVRVYGVFVNWYTFLMIKKKFGSSQATFSEKVVHLALAIPKGQVTTYGNLARAAGGGTMASQSITAILGRAYEQGKKNIPFHRIVYADGRIWVDKQHRTLRMKKYKAEGIRIDEHNRIVNFHDIVLESEELRALLKKPQSPR